MYKVLAVPSVDKLSRRFLELGFTKGVRVKIVATSLSKKVFLLQLRGYQLSVRAKLLEKIEVQKC